MSSSMLNFFYYCCFLLYCCCCEYLTTCTVFMTHNVLLYVGTYSTYLLSEGVQAPPPLSILKPRWQNLFHSLPVCLTQVLHMITAEKNPDRSLSCSRGLFKFVNLVVNIVYRERRKCDAPELRKLECLAKPHSPTVWGNKNEAIDKTTISFLSVSENAQIFSCLCVIISLSGLALSLGTQAVESLPKPHSLSAQSQCYATANYFHSAPTKPGEGEREDIIKEREGRGADRRTSESQVRKEIVRLIKVKVKKLMERERRRREGEPKRARSIFILLVLLLWCFGEEKKKQHETTTTSLPSTKTVLPKIQPQQSDLVQREREASVEEQWCQSQTARSPSPLQQFLEMMSLFIKNRKMCLCLRLVKKKRREKVGRVNEVEMKTSAEAEKRKMESWMRTKIVNRNRKETYKWKKRWKITSIHASYVTPLVSNRKEMYNK